MIIEPRMRGFICLTAHPKGCEQNVKNQIAYVKSKGKINGPKRVLVIGASTGFGLASRITSAFGSDAATIGVFFEKAPAPGKTASPGWYNSAAFQQEAEKAGLYAKSINGDAFSDAVKAETIETIKRDLPEGFQRSEFLLEHGFLDFIIDRKNLKERLGTLLVLFKN